MASASPSRRPGWLNRSMFSKVLLAASIATIFTVFSPDRLILFPSRGPVSSYGAVRRTLPFRKGELEIWTARSAQSPFFHDGRELHSAKDAHPPKPTDVYILRFYGNADRADGNVVSDAGVWPAGAAEVWGMNYPGFGGSTGPAHLESIGPAALETFDALQKEAAGKPIIVYGTSLGTTAALYVAANRPVAGTILQNPPPIRQIIMRQFGWWNFWLMAGPMALAVPKTLDSVANAQAAHAPCVFVLAEKDDMIQPKYQQLVVSAYAGEKRVVTQLGANHNEPLDGATTSELNRAIEWMMAHPAKK